MGETTPLQEGLLSTEEEHWKKGEKQPSACKDVVFAILFLVQVVAIVTIVVLYGTKALREATEGNVDFDYSGFIYAAVLAGIFSFALSAILVQVMMALAGMLVKISLLFSVALGIVVPAIALFYGSILWFILGLLNLAITVCYAKAVWSRIPFATANLEASLAAIKSNFGITLVSYLFVILAFLWSIVWTIATIGVYDKTTVCDEQTNVCSVNYGFVFLLLLSFYWTHQVIVNTLHVTVAGVVGTWWFAPEEASSCCSSAITGSLFRSTTYSFGSICFGSLIVALFQALRAIVQEARRQGDGNDILMCITDCLLNFMEDLAQYFNRWAYIYVGLYGYGYLDAGKNVMTLFKERGWEVVISEDLVGGVLFLVSIITGLLSGLMGLILESTTDLFGAAGDSAGTAAFLLSFIIGLLLCSIVLNTIASGVNTVIVLFAEAPAEFQANHPELSNKMRSTYMEFYPDLF